MKRVLAMAMAVLILLCCGMAGADTIVRSEVNKKKNTIRYTFTDEDGNPLFQSAQCYPSDCTWFAPFRR